MSRVEDLGAKFRLGTLAAVGLLARRRADPVRAVAEGTVCAVARGRRAHVAAFGAARSSLDGSDGVALFPGIGGHGRRGHRNFVCSACTEQQRDVPRTHGVVPRHGPGPIVPRRTRGRSTSGTRDVPVRQKNSATLAWESARRLARPGRSGGMADAADSKSVAGNGVRVQVPPSAPRSSPIGSATARAPAMSPRLVLAFHSGVLEHHKPADRSKQ